MVEPSHLSASVSTAQSLYVIILKYSVLYIKVNKAILFYHLLYVEKDGKREEKGAGKRREKRTTMTKQDKKSRVVKKSIICGPKA